MELQLLCDAAAQGANLVCLQELFAGVYPCQSEDHARFDEAEPLFERARHTDPLASFPYMLTALGLLTAKRPQEAHGYAEQALTFERDDASALFCSSLANVAPANPAMSDG